MTPRMEQAASKKSEESGDTSEAKNGGTPGAKERAKWLQEQAFKKEVVTSKGGVEIEPSSSVSDRMKWLRSKVDEYQKGVTRESDIAQIKSSKPKVVLSDARDTPEKPCTPLPDLPKSVGGDVGMLPEKEDINSVKPGGLCDPPVIDEVVADSTGVVDVGPPIADRTEMIDSKQQRDSGTEDSSARMTASDACPSPNLPDISDLPKSIARDADMSLEEEDANGIKSGDVSKTSTNTEVEAVEAGGVDVGSCIDGQTKMMQGTQQCNRERENLTAGTASRGFPTSEVPGISDQESDGGDACMSAETEGVNITFSESVSDASNIEVMGVDDNAVCMGASKDEITKTMDATQQAGRLTAGMASDACPSSVVTDISDLSNSGDSDAGMLPEKENISGIKTDSVARSSSNVEDVANSAGVVDAGSSTADHQTKGMVGKQLCGKGTEDLAKGMPSDACFPLDEPHTSDLPKSADGDHGMLPEEEGAKSIKKSYAVSKSSDSGADVESFDANQRMGGKQLCDEEAGGLAEGMPSDAACPTSDTPDTSLPPKVVDTDDAAMSPREEDDNSIKSAGISDSSNIKVVAVEADNVDAGPSEATSRDSKSKPFRVYEIPGKIQSRMAIELKALALELEARKVEEQQEKMKAPLKVEEQQQEKVEAPLKVEEQQQEKMEAPLTVEEQQQEKTEAPVKVEEQQQEKMEAPLKASEASFVVGSFEADKTMDDKQLCDEGKEGVAEGMASDTCPTSSVPDITEPQKNCDEDTALSQNEDDNCTKPDGIRASAEIEDVAVDANNVDVRSSRSASSDSNNNNLRVSEIPEEMQSLMALELKAMALELEARKVEEQQKMLEEERQVKPVRYRSSAADLGQGDIQPRIAVELKARKAEEQRKKREEEEHLKARGYHAGYYDPIQGDIQSRMALELRARKVEDQREKKEVEERIKAGGYKLGVVDQSEGDIQSRLALELKARKDEEQRKKKKEEERLKAGGHRASVADLAQGDIQSRLALELKARKVEEQQKKREVEECIKAGGYRMGVVDQSQGDIQFRMALELKARKVEEQRKKREEEERIKAYKMGVVDQSQGDIQSRMALELKARKAEEQQKKRKEEERAKAGGYWVSATDLGQGDIQTRLALELKARKVEDQRQKREAELRVKAGGLQTSVADLGQGDIQSRLALELKARKSEEQRKKKEGEELVFGYRAGVKELTHGSAQTRMALEIKARKEEEQRKRNEADELAKLHQSASLSSTQGSVDMSTAEPLALGGQNMKAVQQHAYEQGTEGCQRNSLSLLDSELSALEDKMNEYAQKRFADNQGSEGSLRNIQFRTASELRALEGMKKAAKGQFVAGDQDSKESVQSAVASELHALRGKKKEAMEQYLNDQGDSHKKSTSHTASELSALEDKTDEVKKRAADGPQGSRGSLRNIQSRTSLELKALQGKRKAAEEQFSGAGNVNSSERQIIASSKSPVITELKALRGKRSEATRSFVKRRASGGSLKDIQSHTATELKALEGKRKEAEEQLASTRTGEKNVQPSTVSELHALAGKKKEAMDQYVCDQGSSDGILESIKSRTASELAVLEGKKKGAEETFEVARTIVDKKDATNRTSKAEEREYHQVKEFFDLVSKDGYIGRAELEMLLVVFGKTTGRSFSPEEIGEAFEEVDKGGFGCIGFDAFFQLYKKLYFIP